jgi:hypothetical protein
MKSGFHYLVPSLSSLLLLLIFSSALPRYLSVFSPVPSSTFLSLITSPSFPLPTGCAGRGTLRGTGRQDIGGEEIPSVLDPTRPMVRVSGICQSSRTLLSSAPLLQSPRVKRQNILKHRLARSLMTAYVIILTFPVTVSSFSSVRLLALLTT